MVRSRALPLGLVIGLFGLPVVAGELDAFISASDGAISCWSRVYDAAHMGQHPQQTVTEMRFAVGYVAGRGDYSAMYWFALSSHQRDGVAGFTTGTCTPQGEAMRCGVDCDGGGVVVNSRNAGNVLLDLHEYGYIRMFSACGTDSAEKSFSLEAGLDDKEFLLRPISGPRCEAMRPDWR